MQLIKNVFLGRFIKSLFLAVSAAVNGLLQYYPFTKFLDPKNRVSDGEKNLDHDFE